MGEAWARSGTILSWEDPKHHDISLRGQTTDTRYRSAGVESGHLTTDYGVVVKVANPLFHSLSWEPTIRSYSLQAPLATGSGRLCGGLLSAWNSVSTSCQERRPAGVSRIR